MLKSLPQAESLQPCVTGCQKSQLTLVETCG